MYTIYSMCNMCDYMFQIIKFMTEYCFFVITCVTYCMIIHLCSIINSNIISYTFPFVVSREVNFDFYLTLSLKISITKWAIHTQIPLKRDITHNSKTSGSKVFFNLTSGQLEFMQITRVIQSCNWTWPRTRWV